MNFEPLIWRKNSCRKPRVKRKSKRQFFHRRNLLRNWKTKTVADGRRRPGNKEAEKMRKTIVWKKSFGRLLWTEPNFSFPEFLPFVFWFLETLFAGACLKTIRFLTTAAMVRTERTRQKPI